jgi:hypothetical protein
MLPDTPAYGNTARCQALRPVAMKCDNAAHAFRTDEDIDGLLAMDSLPPVNLHQVKLN